MSGVLRDARVKYEKQPTPAVGLATAEDGRKISQDDRSVPAGTTLGDFLDEPQIAVGVVERAERPIAGALGVRTGLTCLDRERRTVPDVAHVDATADQPVVSLIDVVDDEGGLDPPGEPVGSPKPNVIEVGELGGVSWTKRSPSIGATSSSSRQPNC